jgi:hypothetical protein
MCSILISVHFHKVREIILNPRSVSFVDRQMSENRFNSNTHGKEYTYFILCKSCFWCCTSRFDISTKMRKCIHCNKSSNSIGSIYLSLRKEAYNNSFDYNSNHREQRVDRSLYLDKSNNNSNYGDISNIQKKGNSLK